MTEPCNWVVRVRRFGGPDEMEIVAAPMPTVRSFAALKRGGLLCAYG